MTIKSDARTQSEFLSFLLRHGAPEQGIELGPGGWAAIAEVDRVASFPVTAERIRAIVASSDKAPPAGHYQGFATDQCFAVAEQSFRSG